MRTVSTFGPSVTRSGGDCLPCPPQGCGKEAVFIVVATLAAASALAASCYGDGCATVLVESLHCTPFMYEAGSTLTADGITILTAIGGRLLRVPTAIPAYTNQKEWHLDEANVSGSASDENDGKTAATALLTANEIARRLFVAKYDLAFSPYLVFLESEVSSEAFQWGFTLEPGGVVPTDPDGGVQVDILTFLGQATEGATQTVTGFTAAGVNTPAKITAPALAAGDVLRFAAGDVAVASSTGVVSRDAIIAINDTFAPLTFTKFRAKFNNAGAPQGFRISAISVDYEASSAFEVLGCVFRLIGSICRTVITPGIGARVQHIATSIVFPTLSSYTVERGFLQGFGSTFINVLLEVAAERGDLQLAGDLHYGGAIVLGAHGPTNQDAAQSVISIDSNEFYEWPSPTPASTIYADATPISPGGAVNMRRLGKGFWKSPISGFSSAAGSTAINIAEGAALEVLGVTPTIAGQLTQITFDADPAHLTGFGVPVLNAATGAPTGAGAIVQTWAVWAGASYNSSIMSLRNGTKLFTIA